MNFQEGLGFHRLSHHEQQAYIIIIKAFSSMQTSIDCTKIERSVDLMKVIQTVLGDNPTIIYFNKTQIQTETSVLGKNIILTGVYSKQQAEKMNADLEKKINSIITYAKATSSNDYSLLINLYHYLQKNVKYDMEELKSASKGICKTPVSHNAYGALINGLAVCDGFSSAFSLLAQKLGFECMLVVGHSAYTSTSFTNHAWNIIKVQNKFYHMDITWDARRYDEYKEYSYVYFAMKDEEINNDHKWDKNTTPSCIHNDLSFYLKYGLYVNNSSQLKEIITANIKKQSKVFRFKLSPSFTLPNKAGDYFSQMIINEAIKPGERLQISYGWNENTRCFFGKLLG